MIGKTVGQYRVIEKLGAGGMGVVYRAEDTKLGRAVALKVLPEKSARDRQAIERLRREARAVSALNHPNICTIHDAGEYEGQPFIVMEFLDGHSLRQRLVGDPFSVAEILDLGVQVADGLDAAHSARLVHRDLKPENIFITKRGHAKILDFGLAKLIPQAHADLVGPPGTPESETTEEMLTSPGAPLGTVAYMSPEQALGKELDLRTDLFSLGVVLYEMATGVVPFRGRTSAAVFDAILNKQPTAPVRLNPDVPSELERIINKTMEKDRNLRYQTASELRADLQRLKRDFESGNKHEKGLFARFRRQRLPMRFAATVLLGASIMAAVLLLAPIVGDWAAPAAPVAGSQTQLTFVGNAADPALSPDGSLLVYGASGKLMLQDSAGGRAVQLHDVGHYYGGWRWSPDGSQLLMPRYWPPFDVVIIPRLGGAARIIGRAPSFGHSCWSPDGKRIATPSMSGFQMIDVSTGASKEIAVGLPRNHSLNAVFDWTAKSDLLLVRTLTPATGGSALWTVRPDGSERRQILEDKDIWSARWDPDERGVYYFHRTNEEIGEIVWIRIRRTGEAAAPPSIVVSGLAGHDSGFSLSSDGRRLVYTRSNFRSSVWKGELSGDQKNPTLRTTHVAQATLRYRSPSVSPDGKWLALPMGQSGARTANIYKIPVDGGTATQLTFLHADSSNPAWSPDGRRIAFTSDESGRLQVWIVDVEGRQPRRLRRTEVIGGTGSELAWSPGRGILYRGPNGKVLVLDPDTEEERPLVKDESFFIAGRPMYSPDGGRVAVKGTTGMWVVSVKDGVGASIITDSVSLAGWATDGQALLAHTGDQMLSIPLAGGLRRVLFTLPVPKTRYVASPDGRKFFSTTEEATSDIWLVPISRPE